MLQQDELTSACDRNLMWTN